MTLRDWVRALLSQLAKIGVVTFGLLWSFHHDWPDFIHTDYGFPLVWATHTTVTFLGPVDRWNLNLANLAIDISILMLVSFLFSVALPSMLRRREAA